MIPERLKSCRGSGLLRTILTLTIMGIISTTTVGALRQLKKQSLYEKRMIQALHYAESGIEDALLQLQANADWTAGFTDKPIGVGKYTVTVTTDARPVLTSTGYGKAMHLLGTPIVTVRYKVEVSTIPQMLYAAHIDKDIPHNDEDQIELGGINSYNSEIDPEPVTFGSSAKVWGNLDVRFEVGVEVALDGDLWDDR